MKLNKNDRVRYNGSMYEVVAVVLATVYLRESSNCRTDSGNCYDMQDVYEKYRDIEILENESEEKPWIIMK